MPKTLSPINAVQVPAARHSGMARPVVDPPVTGGPGPLPETVSKGSEKEAESRTYSASGTETGAYPVVALGALIGGVGLFYYFAIRRQTRIFSGNLY